MIGVNRKKPTKVVLGELNPQSKKFSKARIDGMIGEFIVHPNYSGRASHDDIALIRLVDRVRLDFGQSPTIRPACLLTQEVPTSEKVTATGWGRVNSVGE